MIFRVRPDTSNGLAGWSLCDGSGYVAKLERSDGAAILHLDSAALYLNTMVEAS